jgi:tetratricopeptide (TPR) repeat protein
LEARLNGLPKDPAVHTERLEILAELAGTYLDLGDDAQSEVQARRGLAISRELADPAWSARFWGMLGDLFLQRGETNRAVRAYRKAVRLSPGTPSLWRQLGHYYHIRKRFPDAIIAYKHAVRLDERDLLSHASLAACYRSLMRHSLSQREMETARPLLENADDYHRAVFEAACGNTGKALDLLERALEKEQVEVGQVLSDPNFDSVRETARFQKLTDVSFHTG